MEYGVGRYGNFPSLFHPYNCSLLPILVRGRFLEICDLIRAQIGVRPFGIPYNYGISTGGTYKSWSSNSWPFSLVAVSLFCHRLLAFLIPSMKSRACFTSTARASETLGKVEMEKPTDSGRGEKRKREGESANDSPWPRSKCSSEDLEIIEQRFFLWLEGECPCETRGSGTAYRHRIF